MNYQYHQSTGMLYMIEDSRVTGEENKAGEMFIGKGYSGGNIPPDFDKNAQNNPHFERVPKFGPIPRGRYIIEPALDHSTLGSCALPLRPFPSNEMFDRSGFFIHGDSTQHPGQASEGCIVMPLGVRLFIETRINSVNTLEVVA